MRLIIFTIFFCLCLTASAQAPLKSDEYLKNISTKLNESINLNIPRKPLIYSNIKIVGTGPCPTRTVIKGYSGPSFYDGLKLKYEYKIKIAAKLLNSRKDVRRLGFDLHDSVTYIKSKFAYLIDGNVYKGKQRENKLKTLNPDKIVSFDVYTKNEAYEFFKIKAKYGLIKIEFLDD